MASPLVPTERPIELFCGTWTRTLSTRNFGTFALGADSNCVVTVEQLPLDGLGPPTFAPAFAQPAAPPAHGYKLRWSFGRTPDDVRAGYAVEPLFDAVASASASPVPSGAGSLSAVPRVIPLRVTYAGTECVGTYQGDLGLMMVHLTSPAATATVIYRLLDDDTLAVSITEVPAPAVHKRGEPTIQYGYMFRLPS